MDSPIINNEDCPAAVSLANHLCSNKVDLDQAQIMAKRYRAISQICPIPTFVANSEGAFTCANPAFERMMGVSQKKLIGHGWLDFVHRDDFHIVNMEWAEAIRTQQPYRADMRIIRSDRRIYQISVIAQMLPCESWVGFCTPPSWCLGEGLFSEITP